jgi:endoglucanase
MHRILRKIIVLTFVVAAISSLTFSYLKNTTSQRVNAQSFSKGGMYPDSSYLTNITWDTQAAKVTCGDNAAATWSANDSLYGTIGDCQSSFNVVEVGGTPYNALTKTVLGSKIDGKTWACCGYDGGKVKGSGILAIDNTLYVLGRNWDGRNGVGLVVSNDGGKNFTFNPHQIKIKLGYPVFVNYGKGYSGATSNYVYIWGHGCEDTAYAACDKMHMLRVLKDKILDKTAYEVFIRMEGTTPIWQQTDPGAADLLTKAGSVFDCTKTGKCDRSGITYNAALGRYLVWMSDWNGTDDFRNKGKGGFGIYESATPWDKASWKTAWHTPDATNGWDADGIGDAGNFITKWMSADGKQMYLSYGGTNSFTLRKATFTINGTTTTIPTSSTTTTPISTVTPTAKVTATPQLNCPKKLKGDANCDSSVDLSDFSIFRAEFIAFRNGTPPALLTADFDGNKTVDLSDFVKFREGFIEQLRGTTTPTIIPSVTQTTAPTGTGGISYAPNGYYVKDSKIFKFDNSSKFFRGIDRPSLEWDSKGNNLSLSDYQKIRSWNSNVIRLAVNQLFWRNDTNGYKARLQENINWILSTGMDVIIDLHWSDKGANSIAGQQKMADTNSILFWKDMAQIYKGNGRVMFELYNEPHDVTCDIWKSGGTVDGWQAAGMQQMYEAIRSQGANNLIMVGGLNWAFDLSCVKTHRISGFNIVYATHPYNFGGKNTVADWDNKVGFLSATDPVIITEFGNTQDTGAEGSECDPTFVQNVINWAESKKIHWTAWAWYPGSCAFPALIKDWNGTPNANGRVVMEGLKNNQF